MNLKGKLDIAGRSNTGLVRSNNEDKIGEDQEIGLVVLADGMGGYKGGEVASRLAVNTILDELRAEIPKLTPGEIDEQTGYTKESLAARRSVVKANETIFSVSSTEPQYRGMGTTLVMGIFYDNQITVAHVGDSRMYRFRDGNLQQITVDHTLLQELVDRGFYTQEEANSSLNKNLVTRALGIEGSIAVDIKEDLAMPGDIYILCSDGLTDMVDDPEIHATVKAFKDNLDQLADRLIEIANENGGRDNVSVLLAKPNQEFPSKKDWKKKFSKFLPR
ncbi:MAG: Stp1/IreP family PP2C-type Ser/Thr phosphatase [Gammaproteobacteria bacterium]